MSHRTSVVDRLGELAEHRAHVSARPHRLSQRDVAWRDNDVVWGILLETALALDDVRTALTTVLARDSQSPFARYIDTERGRWRWIPSAERAALVGDLVVPRTETLDAESLGRHMESAQTESLGDRPFRFSLGPNWATLHFSHALGDAGTVWPLFMGLLDPARLAEVVVPASDPAFPLTTALWHTFGRRPSRARTALHGERPTFPLQVSRTRPLRPGVTQVVSRRSDAGYRRSLARHRKEVAPEASVVGMLVARAVAAAAKHGLRSFDGVSVVADGRRYLPTRKFASGNFTAGAYLAVGDPGDPTAVSRAIEAYTGSARPLLTLTMMALRARRGPLTEPVWDEPDEGPNCLVSFSYVGRLPWFVEPPPSAYVLGKPVGAHGLAIVTFELGPYVYASVSFDETHVPRATAEAIAAAVVTLD